MFAENDIACIQSFQLKIARKFILINRSQEICYEKMPTEDFCGLTSHATTILRWRV